MGVHELQCRMFIKLNQCFFYDISARSLHRVVEKLLKSDVGLREQRTTVRAGASNNIRSLKTSKSNKNARLAAFNTKAAETVSLRLRFRYPE